MESPLLLKEKMTKIEKISCFLLTLLIEFITCLFRFAFQFESTRDTILISKITFGIRIHHGYIGILMILIAILCLKKQTYSVVLVIGLSLFFSDIIHHFFVLWPIINSPQFDLLYPN